MSHFAVIVIGEDVEKQLAPYHEYECTGNNDEYVQNVDITADVLADLDKIIYLTEEDFVALNTVKESNEAESYSEGVKYKIKSYRIHKDEKHVHPITMREMWAAQGLNPILEVLNYNGLKDSIIQDGEEPDQDGEHAYGWAKVIEDEEHGKIIVEVVNRTNPNSKWDWWVVGGSWTGYFKAKPGAEVKLGRQSLVCPVEVESGWGDQLRKGDIDWETIRNEAGEKAAKQYDEVHAEIIKGESWLPFEQFRDEMNLTIDRARDEYLAQDVMKRKMRHKEYYWVNLDEFLCTREEFIQAARDGACVPYAVVKDGKWYQKGDMGWWGMSSNEMSQAEWNRKFAELIDGLPDDTLFTAVDCHI